MIIHRVKMIKWQGETHLGGAAALRLLRAACAAPTRLLSREESLQP